MTILPAEISDSLELVVSYNGWAWACLRHNTTNWKEKAPNILEVGWTVWWSFDMTILLADIWAVGCPTEERVLGLFLSLSLQ